MILVTCITRIVIHVGCWADPMPTIEEFLADHTKSIRQTWHELNQIPPHPAANILNKARYCKIKIPTTWQMNEIFNRSLQNRGEIEIGKYSIKKIVLHKWTSQRSSEPNFADGNGSSQLQGPASIYINQHMNIFILRLEVVMECDLVLYIILYKMCRTLGTLPKPFRDIILIGWMDFCY